MSLPEVTQAVLMAGLAVLGLSAALVMVRLERGPTMLDRAVAVDVITIVVLGSSALVTALTGRTDLVPLLAVLAIVGFVGSVTIGRFTAAESPDEARILTKEEIAEPAPVPDEAAPVHDPDAESEDRDRGGEHEEVAS